MIFYCNHFPNNRRTEKKNCPKKKFGCLKDLSRLSYLIHLNNNK